jgi:tetratricopeptide (TPR) repeat protein
VLGLLALYRGRFEAAAAAFVKLYERGTRNQNVQHQVWACIGWAECQLRSGRTDEAARHLETALELLLEHPDHAEQIRAYGLLAPVRLRQEKTEAAEQAASSAASLIVRFKRPTSFYLLEGYGGVAEVYPSLWDNGQDSHDTRQAAQRACLALRRFSRVFPIGEPRARCGAVVSSTSRAAQGEHGPPGGLASPPPSGLPCRSGPRSHTSHSAGMRPVRRRDVSILNAPKRYCASLVYPMSQPAAPIDEQPGAVGALQQAEPIHPPHARRRRRGGPRPGHQRVKSRPACLPRSSRR